MNPKEKAVSGKSSKSKQKQPASKGKSLSSVLKVLLIIFIVIFCAGIGIGGGLILGYIKTADPISPDQLQISKFTSFVYDDKENEITQLKGEENRVWVDDKDIPQHVKNAFVALEDERFFEHPGVDIQGLASAVVGKILHPDRPMRGASTMTQQVIKVFTGKDERSLKRKIQEQYNAILLERSLEKWQILEMYMNLVITGPNIYGVQTASKYYFNKDVKDLTIAEAACIAGITNNPSIYSPISDKGKENNKNRQKDCLNNMLRLEMITQQEYDQAVNEELKFVEGNIKNTSRQSYFVDQLINDVKKDLMEKYKYSEPAAYRIIYSGGIKIYSTMDSNVQKGLDEVFTDPQYFPKGNKDRASEFAAQAAMVIIDPSTGQVKGLYGGSGEKKADMIFNYATQARRQPGSTMKPIAVYGPALDLKLITAGTVVDDVPSYLNPQDPGKIYPMNYDFNFGGLTAIRDGIRNSINVVASKVWLKVGADQSLKYLSREGINLEKSKDGSLAPMALGALTNGLSAYQLAAAYVPFANKGIYVQPVTYTKVLDKDGKVLLENKTKSNVVYDNEQTAYIMTDMMKGVVTNGTAYPYGTIKNAQGQVIPTAGKTGTTSDNKDKWFVGFSTNYVGATWYGYKNPTVINSDERNNALRIWNAVMTKVHKDVTPADFSRPAGIVQKNICILSGKSVSDLCAQDPRGQEAIRYGELFIKGTEPADDDKCDVHVVAKVDKDSRDGIGRMLLAGPNCPQSSIIEKVFVKRSTPYVPRSPNDPYPQDWIYEYPEGKYCQIHNNPDDLNPDGTLKETPKTTPPPSSDDDEESKSTNPLKSLFDKITGGDSTNKSTNKDSDKDKKNSN